MSAVQCSNCGLIVQVPEGGRRLCGCGHWLSAEQTDGVAEVVVEAPSSPHPYSPPLLGEGKGGGGEGNWPKIEGDLSAIERLNDGYRRLINELGKIIVGQKQVLEELLIAIFARGHCLLVGVPGLAKT